MYRPFARALRTIAPSFYARARCGLSLAQWCTSRALGLSGVEGASYGDDFWALQNTGDWDGLATLIVERFAPRVAADVGCGDGKLLAAITRVAPGIVVTGFDSSVAALAVSRRAGVPAERFDLAFAGTRSSEALAARVSGCDLAISLETVEHLPPWSARPFVHVLTQAPVVVFSAAQPGQGGTMHLNERPRRYWAERFAQAGHDPHPGSGAFEEDVRRLDLPWWYARNIQVFRLRTT